MRASRWSQGTILILLAGIVVAGVLLWRSQDRPLRSRSFEFEYVVRIPEVPPKARTLRLWIPVAESDEQQEISHFSISSPVRYELHREPEYGNRYAYLELTPPNQKVPFEVRLQFQAERREHRVALASSTSGVLASTAPVTPAELARCLQPDRLVPIDGLIAQLAAQETHGRSTPLEKARGIYDYVVSTMQYDKTGAGWGRGDAIYACNVRKGNCTDFHALFIGMMRAAGIPARFEIGFPLPPNKAAGDIGGYHCWAQFYLEGMGWIPVDASEAWKNPSLRDYFFGAHDEHRVLFSRGRDIRFNPPQQGEPLNYFIYPYVEVDGKPFTGVESKFSFRDRNLQTR